METLAGESGSSLVNEKLPLKPDNSEHSRNKKKASNEESSTRRATFNGNTSRSAQREEEPGGPEMGRRVATGRTPRQRGWRCH
ncbi:hypothetical protein Tco_0122815 [Tanacetum coccineum]